MGGPCPPLPGLGRCVTATGLKTTDRATPRRRRSADAKPIRRRHVMPDKTPKIGWIGMGRMGFPMAERLLKAGYDVSIWNRTRSKAEPLAKLGGKVVDKPSDLAGVDVLFAIVSTGKDLEQVYFGPDGVGA